MKLFELYQEEKDSTVTHAGIEYSVNKLLADSEDSEVSDIEVSKLEWIIDGDKPVDSQGNTLTRMKDADITKPILITKWKGKWVVLDGIHRLLKAKDEKIATLPCKKINAADLDSAAI